MDKRQGIIILITLILVLLIINYPYLDNSLEDFLTEKQQIKIGRVIDGDTIVSNGTSIRLLGINSPERGEPFYSESKAFLENLILNETVTLEFTNQKQDKYYRILAYVFHTGENINVKLVRNGFANYYFYSGKDKYSDELLMAWEECLDKEVNLCELSNNKCASCMNVNETKVINNCDYGCDLNDWIIKGEGREKFVFNTTLDVGENTEFYLDLSDSGGSLFLRDSEGKLVLWKQ